MPLSDLLDDALGTTDSDCWDREWTATPVRAFTVQLHSAGLSLRETVAILDLLDVDRFMGTVDAEPLEDGDNLSERQPHRMETYPEHPDGCQGALVVPNLITIHAQRLFEQVTEFHDQFSLRPAHSSSHLN